MQPLSALESRLSKAQLLQPDVPFSPRSLPMFYGWVILAATSLGVLMSIPGQTAGVSVFTDDLIAATGLSRLTLSNAYLVGTITSGLLLPFGGVFIDRFGARPVVVASSLWLGATLIYLSFSDRLAAWLGQVLPVNVLAISFVTLCFGFVNLRFSGQGMLTLVSRTTLGKWFNRRRGLASGVAGLFASFGFSAAPLLLSLTIDALGWRGAWRCLAVLVGVGMSLLGWLLYRDNPEECGLVMDGEMPDAPVPGAIAGPPIAVADKAGDTSGLQADTSPPISVITDEAPRDFTRSQALRTLAFWAATLALASQALSVTGITFHIVDIGAAAGLPEKQVVALFLPIAGVSTLVGWLVGIASDRVALQRLFLTMMVLEAAGILGMAHLESLPLRLVAIAGLGCSGGCFGTLSTVTMPRYFGRRHLGAIAGVEMMTLVIASAIGPSLLALFDSLFGSYRLGLYVCAALPLVIVVLLVPMENPQS
ncbi:MAG: MFS transporter [Cyanobacteria bacterium P01_A01_bin.135]